MTAAEIQTLAGAAFGRGWARLLAQRLGLHALSVSSWGAYGVPRARVPAVLAACRAQAAENKRAVGRLSRHIESRLRKADKARAARLAEKRGRPIALSRVRAAELERYLKWAKFHDARSRGYRDRAKRLNQPIPDWLKGVYVTE